MFEECASYSFKQMNRKKHIHYKGFITAYYLYSVSFCKNIERNLETVIEEAVFENLEKSDISLLFGAAMMLCLRKHKSGANALLKKILIVSNLKQHATEALDVLINIFDILLNNDESEQLHLLNEIMISNADSEALSNFTKSVIYYRMYEISGELNYKEKCLEYAWSDYVKNMYMNFENWQNPKGD